MKMFRLASFTLLLILIFHLVYAWADISRGDHPGELYFGSTWYYMDIGERYDVICFSDDYGQTLSFKYICDIDNGDMRIGNILSDATEGVFYNCIQYPPETFISTDCCSNWVQCSGFTAPSPFYTSGNEVGVIYMRSYYYEGLYKSHDFGETFEQVNDTAYGFLEIGTEPGEIYYNWGPSMYHDFQIFLSTNGGIDFEFIQEYDSTVAGYNLSGHYPRIFHGSQVGELYLVSWHLPENFKIFYSTDYGASFELRYESPMCNFYYEGYVFTPGFEQGTFYYIKGMPWFDGINTKVHIFFSDDTAKTFTEHIHILDSNFPVNIYDEQLINQRQTAIYNYPNPFTSYTTIELDIDEANIYSIELLSLSGQAMLREDQYFNIGCQKMRLNTNDLTPGVYLCSIRTNGKVFGVKKIIKGK